MTLRSCKTCGGFTPSPWLARCRRPACADAARAEIDAIVAEAVRDLQRKLRAALADAGDGERA